MIKPNHYSSVDYSALEVGDKLAVMTQYVREYRDAKPCEVVKVTPKQVKVKWSDTESVSFMKESRGVVGAKGYGADRWRLITLEQVEADKQAMEALHTFQKQITDIETILKNRVGRYSNSISSEAKAELLTLVNALAVNDQYATN